MKINELIPTIYDKIILYRNIDDDYIDIFKGIPSEIPNNMLDLEIKIIGAKRKNILDIEVI